MITWRKTPDLVLADVDDGVDVDLLRQASLGGNAVLVETEPGKRPLVVGVVQRTVPASVSIQADTITLDARQEVTVRAGNAALRLREDGEVELVGRRISTLSRGLFRIVGRILRSN